MGQRLGVPCGRLAGPAASTSSVLADTLKPILISSTARDVRQLVLVCFGQNPRFKLPKLFFYITLASVFIVPCGSYREQQHKTSISPGQRQPSGCVSTCLRMDTLAVPWSLSSSSLCKDRVSARESCSG